MIIKTQKFVIVIMRYMEVQVYKYFFQIHNPCSETIPDPESEHDF